MRKGDRYVLNGEKMWISLADVADHFLVIAWTDQDKKRARDHSGMSAFIVERGFSGFSSFSIKEKWGILAGNTGGFSLQDVEVPVENRLGEEGIGSDFSRPVLIGRLVLGGTHDHGNGSQCLVRLQKVHAERSPAPLPTRLPPWPAQCPSLRCVGWIA